MNRILKKTGFTLVELVVVVTILSILSTIGFLSFSKYSQSARDSVRKSDIKNIHKVLDLYRLYNNVYPEPSDAHEVVYSGFPLWKQGGYGKETQATTGKLFGNLVDPKFGNNYSYSVSSSGKEYQIGTVYERTEVAPDNPNFVFKPIIASTYADNPIASFDPRTLFADSDSLRFWYDGKDIDADGNNDLLDGSIPNVGIVENVNSIDFTPFYFDRVIWLDSQDINGDGTTPTNGSDINSWINKTGAGFDGFIPQSGNNHSSPAHSTSPSYSATGFGGNPGVYFDGVPRGDRVVIDRGGQEKGQTFSLAYTFKVNDAAGNSAENAGTNHATIISVGPTGGGEYYRRAGGWQLSRDGRKNSFVFRINGTITNKMYFNGANCNSDGGGDTCGNSGVNAEIAFGDWSEINDNIPHTVFVTYEGDTVTGYLDGTKRFEATFSSTTKPYGEYFRFFGNRAGTAYLEGMLGEVFIANDRMSLQDLEKIEGYFAEKWDWQDELPVDHPYKSNSPYMDAFSQLQYSRYSWSGDSMDDYNRVDFFSDNPTLLNSKTVRFPGSMPFININEDNKVHIWRGPIKVSETGDYTFSLNADDYAFLQIDGAIIVDAGADVSGVQSGTISLTADTLYDFELVYGEYDNEASLDYRAEGPGVIGYRQYEAYAWNDRSTFSRNLSQVVPEFQPNYNPTALSFNISPDSYFNFPSDPYSGTDNFEIFTVWQVNETIDGSGESYFLENSTSGSGFLGLGGRSMMVGSIESGGTNILGKNATLSSYQLDNTEDTQKYYVGGQNYHQNTTDILGFNSGFTLGSNSLGFSGNIKEVIGFAANLSLDERETIEGYLSHKWGIAHKLDISHPYHEPLETGEEIYVEVSGNYNGIFSHGSLGDTHVIVASPSIMSSYDTDFGSSVDITTLIGENKLVYNGFRNVPSSYSAIEEVSEKLTTKNGFYFESSDPLLFKGPKSKLANYVGISQVDENIRKTYTSSHLYPYVSYYLDENNSDYVKDILGNIIGLNPITPYYCKDILEKSRGINIGIFADVIGSSGDEESEGIMSLNDNITVGDIGDYSYITNLGDNPELIFNWDSFQTINLVRIHNSFGPFSKNLWSGTLELLDENDSIVYTHIFGNTEGVSTIEIYIDLDDFLEPPVKMKIRPSSDYARLALREIEVYAGDDIVSGVYKVDDDGIGGKSSYQVYCDMLTSGGGWTRIGDNFINASTFRNQLHPDAYTFSNAANNTLRNDIPLPSYINEGSVLHQTGSGSVEYELEFLDIPNVEFTSEIRLGAWIRNTSESIFNYSIEYESGNTLATVNPKLLKSEGLWKFYEARIPITDVVESFTWHLGKGVTKGSGVYVTGVEMNVYYK